MKKGGHTKTRLAIYGLVLLASLFSASALAVDTDGDGVDDSIDAFPNDPCGATDTDGDGMPDVLLNCSGMLFDGFETGNFSANPWTSSPAWSVVTGGHSGNYSASSPHATNSTLSLAINFLTASTLQFYFKTTSNGLSAPGVDVYLDGTWVGNLLNSSNWTQRKITIPAGSHALKFQTYYGGGGFSCMGGCYTDINLDDFSIIDLVEDLDDDNDGLADTQDCYPLDNTRTCDPGTYKSGNSIVQAPAGYYAKNGVLVQCAAGTYQGQTGQSSCNLTPAGSYSNAGAIAPITCAAGLVSYAGSPNCSNISLESVNAISAADHTCIILSSGTVQCWGDNRYGQLGDGTTTNSSIPVTVTGLSGPASLISSGSGDTCALLVSGVVQCWGLNSYGELGDGTTTNSSTPVTVIGLSGSVVSITTDGAHTCALLKTGAVQCWGYNYEGELGNGTFVNSSTPVTVVGLSGPVSSINSNGSHTCALLVSGAVQCWGYNYYGQLGDGTTTNSSSPVTVTGLSGAVNTISLGGNFTCALFVTGGVQCWGNGIYGQLGNGIQKPSSIPVAVIGLSEAAIAISSGSEFTCAILASRKMQCWGNNDHGQLGAGISSGWNVPPIQVVGLAGSVSAISTGDFYACALLDFGDVQCWGFNASFRLGNSTTTTLSSVPLYAIITHSACSAGYYGPPGSNNCTLDIAGTYSAAGATSATNCPSGTWSDAGASSCYADTDGDHIGDSSDNCPLVSNADQKDTDGDGIGDACDPTPHGDTDGDGIDNLVDNCPSVANADQKDTDGDGIGDACDPSPNGGDTDNDGVADFLDCYPNDNTQSACAAGTYPTGTGFAQAPAGSYAIDGVMAPCPAGSWSDVGASSCYADTDGDHIANNLDNCPTVANANQLDTDGDGIGDACDPTPHGDTDGDGIDNAADNCPFVANPDQADSNNNGIGDVCDPQFLKTSNGTRVGDADGSAVVLDDVDADGIPDVIIGSPLYDVHTKLNGKAVVLANAGKITILSGADGTVLRTHYGTAANQHFGSAIAVVNDLDGDYVHDLAVGEPAATVTNGGVAMKRAGRVAIYSTNTGDLINVIATGSSANELFGSSLAFGDVNNDAQKDLVVGSANKITVLDGLTNNALYTRSGTQLGEHFGAAVAFNARDKQLLVGSPAYDVTTNTNGRMIKLVDAGRVQIFDATDLTASSAALLEVDGAHAKDNFGAALASFDADLDGDGQTEWMAGIPGADFSKNINGKPSIQGDTGMAAVFSGLNATATYVFNGRTAGDRYGTALGIAVDQTHAGQHILAIGAKKADITKTVAGKVRVQRDAGNVFVLRVE